MKKIAKIFALFIAVLGLAGLVACDNDNPPVVEPVQPYNALGSFVEGGDGVYDITTNSASELTFSYDKVDEALAWSHIYTEISADAALENYKKLVITAKGSGTMMIKIEGADGAAREVSINVQSNATTYDWNLMNDAEFLKGATKIVIFGAPGKAESVGNITITSLTFDENIAGASGNFIIATGYNDIPSNVNEYNGKDVNFDFNAKWESGDAEVYEIEQDAETKEVSVKYNKSAGMEWAYMISNVKGDFGKFKYVVVVLKGTEGNSVLVKAEGQGVAKEVTCHFDGSKQTVVLDISTFTADQKSAIAKIVLFGHPGAEGKGNFKIYEAYMTETAPIEIEETVVNEYDGTSEKFDISNHWYDGGDGVYTVSKVENGVKVEYNKTGEWQTLKAYVRNVASKFNYVVVEATGAAGATIMLKAANGVEKQFEFTGELDQLVLDISGMADADKEGLTEFIIFGHPGSKAEGSFTIHNAYYAVEVEGVEKPTVNEYSQYAEEFDVNHYWASGDAGEYDFVEENGITTVNYHTTGGWKFFSNPITGVTNQFNYLKVTLLSDKDVTVTLKPGDVSAYEKHIDLVANEQQTLYLAIPENIAKIVGFIAGAQEAGATGTVQFIEMKLVRSYVVGEETAVNLMDAFYPNGDPVYTISSNEIAYNKGNYTWAYFKALLVGETSGFTAINMTVKGEAGLKLLVKPNDNGSYEQWFDLDGTEQTFVIDNLPEQLTSVVVFVAPDVANIEGTIEVVEFEAVKGIQIDGTDLEVTYEDKSEKGYYTVSQGENGIDIQYNHLDAGWYYVLITPTQGAIEDVEKLSFIVEGNVQILVKPNDKPALEQWVTLEGEQLVEVAINENLEKIIFFVSPNAVGEGTITIKKVTVTISAVTENIYTSGTTFDVNHYWASGDAGEYDFVEEDGITTVNYHTTGGWKFFSNPIVGVTNQFNYLKATLLSDKDVTVTLKPGDISAYEKHINLVANEKQTLYLAIPENISKIVGFIAGAQEAGATGTVQFIEMTLVNLTDSSSEFAANFKDCGDNVYTVTPLETGASVAYNKTGQEWAAMYVDIYPVSMSNHELVVTVKGEAGVQVLIKLNNKNAHETWYTMDGNVNEIVVTNVPTELSQIHIFFGGGVATLSGTAELQVIVNEKEVDTTPLTLSVSDKDGNVYTATGDINTESITVAYTKTGEWNGFFVNLSKTVKVAAIKVVCSSEDGKNLIIKPNDGYEKNLALTAEGTTFEWTFDDGLDLVNVVFIAAPGEIGTAGSFTIVSLEITLAE